jgi:uncharacterized protein YceK
MSRILIAVMATFLLTGCATITRSTNQAYVIETNPSGADVRLSNGYSCVSPCSLQMKRKPGFQVTISKDGYKTVTTNVSSQVSSGGGAGMAGNVIFGGIPGLVVDSVSGAMNELIPNPLVITLERD